MKRHLFLLAGILAMINSFAQDMSLVNTSKSPYAKLKGVGMTDVHWTKGFWGERFQVCKDSMVPHLWSTYTSKDFCFSFQNFRVAAGIDTGRFRGPSFHDGDFYKTFEAVAATYALTKDAKLNQLMDEAISVIAKAQREDGYVYTKSIIEQKKTGVSKMFDDHLSFEAYNFGHLMTAACVHYRATGKNTLLAIARKATDFLIQFYNKASPEQARNAICPSHYMGIIEMYRTTGEAKYKALAQKLIDIRGTTEGSDDNSDKLPFRKMTQVNGHAVRANYLFAGVADVYAETGDSSLLHTLDLMWDDVVNSKMYITGGCGALYDGLSLEGVSYKPDSIQKIQQAYGKEYELPNLSAHNETCANIGNMLWNWRMLQLTADARYADVMEQTLYNSILSGISLDGNRFFYTNPLAALKDNPYQFRWGGGRSAYISKSNCCPPNVVRTIAEVNNYMYSVSKEGLYIHLYGGNQLSTRLSDYSPLRLEQITNYPWDGNIAIRIKEAPEQSFGIFLRIPEWCKKAFLKINGKITTFHLVSGKYQQIKRVWKAGDQIDLVLDMPVKLIEANPMVESSRNQVAVKRGPIVYCLESADLQPDQSVEDILIPSSIQFAVKPVSMGGAHLIALEGNAQQRKTDKWNNQLYRDLQPERAIKKIRLIPYFSWANRGLTDMSVWLPLVQ